MRRPLAILALAATFLPQVAAVRCGLQAHAGPVAAPGHATRAAVADAQATPARVASAAARGSLPKNDHHPASDARHPRHGAHEHGSREDGNETCSSAMMCGTVMVESVRQARTIELPTASRLDPAPPTRAASVVPPTADPPPPRPLV